MARRMMDIALGPTNDLLIQGGDFVIRESTAQHELLLLKLNKGDLKLNPTRCVGIATYMDDDEPEGVARAIIQEFQQDGIEITDLQPNPASATDNTAKPFINSFYK